MYINNSDGTYAAMSLPICCKCGAHVSNTLLYQFESPTELKVNYFCDSCAKFYLNLGIISLL